MASENETVADIIAEMRRGTKLKGYWRSSDLNEILIYNADRIEAAWNRERAEIEQSALSCGALVERSRNCDVGTAYEQANRMSQYCATQKRGGIRDCAYCPIAKPYQRDCALTWAQMPYEADDPAIDQLRYKMEGEAANV